VCVDYRIRSDGLWQGKTADEKKTYMIREMRRYNELFNFKYTEYFYGLINSFLGNQGVKQLSWKEFFSKEFLFRVRRKLKISVKGRKL
jgi:hypothetical protein